MIKFAHNNFNVLDLEKSLQFYKEALNLKEVRRVEKPDFTLVYLGDNGVTPHLLELVRLCQSLKLFAGLTVDELANRSEERRVGKECYGRCRSRWSPYH